MPPPDQDTVIALYNVRDELTVAEAEQLAYALLAQAAATRSSTAACRYGSRALRRFPIGSVK